MKFQSRVSGDVQAFQPIPALRFYGWNAIAKSQCQVTVHHGVSVAGPLLATINLAVNQSANDWPDPGGIPAPNGIFIHTIAGDVTLSLYATNT